jgi:hypothetical protein
MTTSIAILSTSLFATHNTIRCYVRSELLRAQLNKEYIVNIPCYRPLGLREVEAPTLLRQKANRWRQGCQPYAPAALYPNRFLF